MGYQTMNVQEKQQRWKNLVLLVQSLKAEAVAAHQSEFFALSARDCYIIRQRRGTQRQTLLCSKLQNNVNQRDAHFPGIL